MNTLIRKYMPVFDVFERHEILVNADPGRVYSAVKQLDAGESPVVKWLFRLRGIPYEDISLAGMTSGDAFKIIEEIPEKELLIGLLCTNRMVPIPIRSAGQFHGFSEEGGIRIAWNFTVDQKASGKIRAATETRVQCFDRKTTNIFLAYWFFIRFFSGMTRIAMLKIIKRRSENT